MEANLSMLWRNGSKIRSVRPSDARGRVPAIVLVNPKYPHNLGGVIRAASCYGARQVWFTGRRCPMEAGGQVTRIPREERMKNYADVDLVNYDMPLDVLRGTPVAVEVRENAEDLVRFEHPDDAVYVFGPEDDSLGRAILTRCHRFVVLKTAHCLNLSAAVATVLYDRHAKAERARS